MMLTAAQSSGLSGTADAPGDKSVSHRALILAGLAAGESRIRGLLEADDVLRTAAALRALGVSVERADGEWRVCGGSWIPARRPLYFGNSGTGCRLMMGAVAGARISAKFEGDASLRRRPMARVLEPLRLMGAQCDSGAGDRLPAHVAATAPLSAIRYSPPTPSAQVKSAILLAGLGAQGETIVHEAVATRDHTERMLAAFGAPIEVQHNGAARTIRLAGPCRLQSADIDVPGDPSSAAFLLAAALITPGSDVTVRNVLMNPTRTGFLEVIRAMGGALEVTNARAVSGETVADLRARYARLKGVRVDKDRASAMIDEYPVLSVIAAFAEGETLFEGVGELRVKESDRIAAIKAGLAANGVRTQSGTDWLLIEGGAAKGGGFVATEGDHRIAMSFLIFGLAAAAPTTIDDDTMIATSFPNFAPLMQRLGARIGPAADVRLPSA